MPIKPNKDILLKIVKFVVAFGLIALMIQQGLIDFSILLQMATPLNLLVGLVLVFLNLGFATYRWNLLLKARHFDVTLRDTFPLSLIGTFFNFAIPGAVGGDVVKAYYIAKDQKERRVEAVTSVIVDRILGLYGMVLLAILTMLLNLTFVLQSTSLAGVLVSSLFLWLGMTAFLVGSLSRTLRQGLKLQQRLKRLPLGGKLFGLYDAVHSYRNHLGAVLVAIVLSLLAQVTAVFFMIFVGSRLGSENLSLATYFFSVPIGFIVSSFPISPAGVGVGQYAFLVLFEMYSGEKTNIGQTAITAFQVFVFLWGLVGGFFYLKKKQPKPLEEALP